MGIDQKHQRFCDECGRTIIKPTRIQNGVEYCATCYSRLFKPLPCSLCDRPTRVHRASSERPVCRRCVMATRTCSRCGKGVPGKAGRVVNGQAVCPACAPHFKAAEPCERCSRLSSRICRAPSLGISQRVCDSCRKRASHITCTICGKYRPSSQVNSDGKHVCRACDNNPLASHPCPDCGVTVPGGGQSKCRACLNHIRIEREAQLQALTLDREWARSFIVNFSEWLYLRSPSSPKLIDHFMSHVPFIQRLDVTFYESSELSASDLLEQFGSKMLRRHLRVTEFLKQTQGLKISASQRTDSSNEDLVAATLRESAAEPWGVLLSNYNTALNDGKLATRTKRMYVRTAANLCRSKRLSAGHPLTTSQLGHYLAHHPSAYTNIARFVRHCVEQWGWDVAMPALAKQRATEDSHELMVLFKSQLEAVLSTGIDHASIEDLGALLASAFGYSIRLFNAGRWSISVMDDKVFLGNASISLQVPQELVSIVQRWLELSAEANFNSEK